MVFSARRIPGTVTLAVTNLVAAWSFVDDSAWQTSGLFQVARDTAPLWVWCLAWLVSALGLLAAIARKSLPLFHTAAGLSITTWAALTTAVWYASIFDAEVTLSPIARGLFFWAIAGQCAMVLAPMIRPSGYYGDGRR